MKLELVPLLAIQRELYDIPRGFERFHEYLRVMIGETDDIALPLPAFNPMGKEHVAETLDRLIARDAEATAREAIADAAERLKSIDLELFVALVVADARGGWTNRHLNELSHRLDPRAELKRKWAVALLWTDEEPRVAETVRAAIYRLAYVARFGVARTLRAIMAQEGCAARFASAIEPALDPEELAYTRAVIEPHLDAEDFPTIFACLYGDEAAKSVGHRALGLSARAGFALALADASDPIERLR